MSNKTHHGSRIYVSTFLINPNFHHSILLNSWFLLNTSLKDSCSTYKLQINSIFMGIHSQKVKKS